MLLFQGFIDVLDFFFRRRKKRFGYFKNLGKIAYKVTVRVYEIKLGFPKLVVMVIGVFALPPCKMHVARHTFIVGPELVKSCSHVKVLPAVFLVVHVVVVYIVIRVKEPTDLDIAALLVVVYVALLGQSGFLYELIYVLFSVIK